MAAPFPSQEHRPLKKPRLGPPDVYPQDAKQKEDELNQTSVKHGFSNTPSFPDEYSSAGVERVGGLSMDKFGSYFASIISKKMGLNTLQDTKKKQQIPSKDNFWPAARSKQGMEAWFKDLAGSKPLAQLSRKVPTFNKKEEIFSTLCEYSVPLVRAAWFIKMTAAHNMATQDSRIRRRQAADQSIDWTQSLTKYLREQLQKIQEHYHSGANGPQTAFLLANHNSQADMESALKQWNYCTRLAKHMYNEGLFDRNETMMWLVELLEKMRNADDTVLKLLLYQIDSYIDEITLSALLSRRLAYFCCKYLQQMCADAGSMSPRTQSPMVTANASGAMTTTSNNQYHPTHPFAAVFVEYRSCPQHRSIIMKLCGIIQTITLRCPTALVWNWLGDGKTSLFICGSPLDILPCGPSSLPMLPSDQNAQVRAQIRVSENLIRQRGRAAEVNWSSDKCQQSQTGFITSKVLTVLDILDRHCFDKVDSTNSLDVLYTNIFTVVNNKEGNEAPLSDEPVIRLLIDWAVSTQRSGEHRAIVTSKILERRQNEMRPEKYQDGEMMEEKEEVGSDDMVSMGVPPFQSLLMDFLDHRAPLLEEHSSEDQKHAFRNLILLFHELIQHDVFSHDAYMCTLISRGDLLCSPSLMQTADCAAPSSVKSPSEMLKNDQQDDIKVDMGIHMGMELDLSSLFGSVKEDPRSSPEPPGLAMSMGILAASVKSVKSEKDLQVPSVGEPHSSHQMGHSHHSSHMQQVAKGTSRHLVYATHMPIPQEDCSSHEYNQRLIVLYGVGKAREEARHALKKTTKEIVKLYSKRNCIDVTSGDVGKVKKKKDKDKDGKEPGSSGGADVAAPASGGSTTPSNTISPANLEVLMQKFQKLSYHDQHSVTAQCTTAILDQMRGFVECNSPYLPQVQPIAFLFELMQHALNLNGLMTFVVDLLKMLCEVERQLVSTESSLMVSYTTKLCLRIVGVLRRYLAYFLASRDIASQVFTSLMETLKVVNVCNPVCCSTEERNMLSFLYDCYTNCSYLKRDYYALFNPAYTRMTTTLYAPVQPSKPNHSLDTAFMIHNIRGQFDLDYDMYKLLDNPPNRYSFVCNVLLEITQSSSTETLNQISIYCAQLTARVPALTSDWLGVLRSLCCSSNHNSGFLDVLTQIDVSDLSLHDNIAVFTAILVSRHCFSLQDFIIHIALPSLLAACPSANDEMDSDEETKESGGDTDAEPGARLSCHLLLRLFKPSLLTSQQSAGPYLTKTVPMVQEACDRQLLEASHGDVAVGPLSAILKAMLILGDETNDGGKKTGSGRQSERNISSLLENLADGDVDMDAVLGSSKSGMESKGLNDFAKHALQEICQQEWVREKFLKDVDHLFTSDLLIDPMLSNKQAQQLLHTICYPAGLPGTLDANDTDHKQLINRVLMNLDQWSLRVSYLELKLLLKQATTQAETNSILDHIARATIDLFHQQTEIKQAGGSSPQEEIKSSSEQETVWLVGPLISRLPSAIQGKVLKLAGQVLESGNNLFVSAKSKQEKDRNLKSQTLLGHQPFLSLVQTCLKGQDEQREGLLNSLMSQLEKFINNTKEILEKTPDESKIRMHLHEALRLRLSLVGAMFDTIQRSNATTSDWAMLLLQLISHEVVDCQTNSELFYTVIDMLSVLVHGTLISDGQEKLEDNKKAYHNLIKKLKKELGDKHTDATDRLRQLLPVPKRFYEVISVEPYGTLVDTRGNRITGFDSIAKKLGLQVGQKIKMSPWEVIEGHKNPAPISWSYFGAIRLEKKTLTHEDQHRLLMFHTHSLRQPDSHYMEPPPLPPEELEPPPEKVEEKPKEIVDTQTQQDNNKKSSKNKNRRSRNKQQGGTAYVQQPGQLRPYQQYQEPMYPPPGPHPTWYAAQQPRYGYTPPMAPGRQQRFSMPGGPTKSALNTLLQGRMNPAHIPPGHTGAAPGQNVYAMQKHNQILLRQHILSKNRMMDPGMYAGAGTMPHSASQSGAMGPMMGQQSYYRSMPGQQPGMMDPMNGGMISPGFNQASYSQQAAPMMQGMAPQQGGYMPQQPMAQGQQFPASGRMPAQMGGAPSMATPTTGMSGMSGYSQMSSGPAPQHQGAYMGQMSNAQMRQQQLQQRQQMMAMQQQQQQQPQQPGQPGQPAQPMQQQQQQTAALVAQLQRRMSSGVPPANAGPPFNSYGQY
ncbi:mediator of RNA polymerase II transcription subunit 12-like protein isoform X2 [Littorina saxatilis]|uniref:mediator of RNA polymerase II transcription subunit 12-like protein isoform X2 n=1 Tax=Littorina saxatilis TaxID=31220 RepID=UPI0038B4949E